MRLADRIFQRMFSRTFVYNILYEDSEVDERFLGIDEASSVLGISGAGCRIAGHLSQRPRRIDAVDINPFHLALTALKVSAAQRLESYVTFYDLFGRGWHPRPERMIGKLVLPLPDWVQAHWRRNYRLFESSLHGHGLTARLLAVLRRLSGVDEHTLRRLVTLPIEERKRVITGVFAPILARPDVALALKSPVNLLALGVNYAQLDRMLGTERLDLVAFFLHHLRRVAETDLAKNWFAWHALAGHYPHDDTDAAPPYLRRDRHERSLGSPTVVAYHKRDILSVLRDAGPRTWSHFTLCDAPDWMSAAQQRDLFLAIHRTSRDGGVMMYRSVETESLIARHGLERRFERMNAESDAATRMDRTRQYRSVAYYRIHQGAS